MNFENGERIWSSKMVEKIDDDGTRLCHSRAGKKLRNDRKNGEGECEGTRVQRENLFRLQVVNVYQELDELGDVSELANWRTNWR